MSIPADEQETVINIERISNDATIYTTDSTYMTKLDKMYPIVKTDVEDGKIVAKTYRLPKGLVTFRKDAHFKPEYQPKRKISEETIKKMIANRKKKKD